MIVAHKLSDFPWVWVRIGCDVCHRSGKYRLARLAERFGAEIPLDDLVRQLSIDCPRRRMGTMKRSRYNGEPCFARLVDLYKPPGPPDIPAGMVKLRVVNGGLSEE
ncbi:conserved hypothetical protein [Hyphomicrobiales bacterium]|nr:conserved hypothetical protein [Hyphomicrobiales bacterium]CAH1667538.1 conserved hypothetical protein [Hyphomicrobiales bacterium]